MADNLVTLPLDKVVSPFEDMLQCARLINRESRAHDQEKQQKKKNNQQLHGGRI